MLYIPDQTDIQCWFMVVVMAGWVGSGMEMVVGKHAGRSQEGLVTCWKMPGTLPECEMKTLITPPSM